MGPWSHSRAKMAQPRLRRIQFCLTMKTGSPTYLVLLSRGCARAILFVLLLAALLRPDSAHASLFHGETLDAVANGLSWIVLILVPAVGIAVFWIVHILPEKIAEKKH